MLFQFWTVSAQPDVFSLDRYGIGVIAESMEEGTFKAHFADSRRLDSAINAQVKAVKDLAKKLESSTRELDLGVNAGRGEIFWRMVQDWHNTIHIEPPRRLVATDIDAALGILSRVYLSRRVSNDNRHKVTKVRQAVKTAYTDSVKIAPHFVEAPLVDAVGKPRKFDFGVAVEQERMLEISNSFSFARKSATDVLDSTEAWTWRVDNLRSDGGRAIVDDREIEIPSDVPVVAFVYPPNTEEQRETFLSATASWRELEIDVVNISDVDKHTWRLEQRIA
ncbi:MULTISPECIES: hypothetical protein [Corynebacterium]|uniref:hypothetical protein n=1 Tax=Corynebacterium TaxID=1716 RepID=UPI0021A62324|nr:MULTISPECIES: hypothetical protein [Corynebacterium]MCT2338038.1 hypothetical protein [Corynebacterium sp. p3-SID1056]MDK8305860.1 hypothetical protein [Corynebacterium imitans]MDK8636673.1 hypothetical protein [Corynebacterium imitans]MDK8772288.1 hypothetical protein [Corynebacterium imitans]